MLPSEVPAAVVVDGDVSEWPAKPSAALAATGALAEVWLAPTDGGLHVAGRAGGVDRIDVYWAFDGPFVLHLALTAEGVAVLRDGEEPVQVAQSAVSPREGGFAAEAVIPVDAWPAARQVPLVTSRALVTATTAGATPKTLATRGQATAVATWDTVKLAKPYVPGGDLTLAKGLLGPSWAWQPAPTLTTLFRDATQWVGEAQRTERVTLELAGHEPIAVGDGRVWLVEDSAGGKWGVAVGPTGKASSVSTGDWTCAQQAVPVGATLHVASLCSGSPAVPSEACVGCVYPAFQVAVLDGAGGARVALDQSRAAALGLPFRYALPGDDATPGFAVQWEEALGPKRVRYTEAFYWTGSTYDSVGEAPFALRWLGEMP